MGQRGCPPPQAGMDVQDHQDPHPVGGETGLPLSPIIFNLAMELLLRAMTATEITTNLPSNLGRKTSHTLTAPVTERALQLYGWKTSDLQLFKHR
ncbi:hypothetical protein Y1Q_0020342 [Alligator mississippiensis]|uniref:Uncharacterized protein n=1 Tax=Alligator mississippiensis TaxID=8496 RepID=A0A151N6F1_ALLMI|nr:hypothetical protein Y1Q_0020342 [Alligator mississippiensis]